MLSSPKPEVAGAHSRILGTRKKLRSLTWLPSRLRSEASWSDYGLWPNTKFAAFASISPAAFNIPMLDRNKGEKSRFVLIAISYL